jgi:hypothetical protein
MPKPKGVIRIHCVCFVNHRLSFCPFLPLCCPSFVLRFMDSYYPFRLWHLETLLKKSCYSFPNRLLCIKILAHLANGNVSFCHHLASVVLTFHILMFSKTACPNEQKLSSYRNHLWMVFY